MIKLPPYGILEHHSIKLKTCRLKWNPEISLYAKIEYYSFLCSSF
jgi:hypothetical protein